MESNLFSRRSFLKMSFWAIGLLSGGDVAMSMKGPWPSYAMIIDLQRCMGCEACVVACKIAQDTPYGVFNTIIAGFKDKFSEGPDLFMPLLCNHCEDPPCQKVCPQGAISKLDNGIVVTDWGLCDGEGLCVKACPFNARHLDPRYSFRSAKCDFCVERLAKGAVPICVETCPSHARLFGDLNDPSGEFKEYLDKGGLFSLGKKHGLDTRVFYAGLSFSENRGLLSK